jgi:hypothetical protein
MNGIESILRSIIKEKERQIEELKRKIEILTKGEE